MNLLENNEKYKKVIKSLKNEVKQNYTLVNLTDVSKAYLASNIATDIEENLVIVCSNNLQASKILQDLKFFAKCKILFFPAKSIIYYDLQAQSKELKNQRMEVIKEIININKKRNKEKYIIVTTIEALQIKMLPVQVYDKEEFTFALNSEIPLAEFIEKLVSYGYTRCDVVEGKGTFAVRGGIVDLFLIDSDVPYRIEFFGDVIDGIRSFDSITQRSITRFDGKLTLSCIEEQLLNEEVQYNLVQKLNEKSKKIDNNVILKENLEKDIEKIDSGKLDNIIDKYYNLVCEKEITFLDYISSNFTIIFDELSKCKINAHNMCIENEETINVLESRNVLIKEFVNKYEKFEIIADKLRLFNVINLEKLMLNDFGKDSEVIEFDFKESLFFKNSISTLVEDINAQHKDKAIVLAFPTKVRMEQIQGYLQDNKIKVSVIDDFNCKLEVGKVYICNGILSGGFSSNQLGLNLLVEPVSNVTKKKRHIEKKDSNLQMINTFEDLDIGDYIVHLNHGIGIYRGIHTVTIQGISKDYIKIEYKDSGILYVSVNQLDLVKRYVYDEDGIAPKINALNSREWIKERTKVTKHIKEIAKELTLLYAKRERTRGYAFSKDTPWQTEFEDSFKYELTEDQKIAVEEIKKDMELERPMDRLLCGDVGYGKTEVALRCAFKAVMDHKQVSYLVPTTVLALQQYNTFKDRMEPFGVRVEMLSRFRTPTEQKKILKDLKDGKIDIIVGTHRVLSKDVIFKDLGLLIIDEEHRFGVKAKETLKMLRENIDVLSMTATPIPRTLHMSLIGIRQMSTLKEPPLERLPVHTYVLEYEPEVIKTAIEKELLRNGQVFYINNRVSQIEDITERLRNLVPEARIGYAHGQMPVNQIEDVMLSFMKHELDIIVCTTILESGIDIPNANTIIIEDSDKLGLAQLYQIRGRVGRSSRIAYAYITYKKNKAVNEVSQKRLKAIRDFTEFGSGFKIALRDLEIRGAGNLIGHEQHGHMARVGYDMYVALLEKAINDEKKKTTNEGIDEIEKEVKIELNVSAYISDSYISDPMQKIAMYQKISNIENKDMSLDVIDELLDRYGDIPKETENLLKIVDIRNMARSLGITKIWAKNDHLYFEPGNLKIPLTNVSNNDILIRVQLEISKFQTILKEKGK